MTSHGLTGPDPTGDYSQERTLALTERLIDALGLGTITLGGTSMGGTVAIQYSAAHPERVLRLILLSPGSLEGQEQKRRGNVPKFAYALKYVMPRALPEFMHLLENAPLLTFISYPGVGHMAVEEAGAEIGKDVRTWLDQPLADNIQKSGPQQDPH
jgi:pimeloyl-ACP methyl ester carboxylesterase